MAVISTAGSIEEKSPLLGSHADKTVTCRHVPARHVLALLGFLGFLVTYSLRASLGVTLVAMVNTTSAVEVDIEDGNGSWTRTTVWKSQGEFDWDETIQGQVLGAYFYGYTLLQVTGGHLAERIGGRNVMGIGVLCSVVLSFVTPVAARAHVIYFIIIRVLQGIAESVTVPAMNAMLGVWAPSHQRSRLANFTYAGVEAGTVIGMMSAGVLSQSDIAGGWPSVFYLNGILGCVWVLFWMLLVHNSPAQHPRITASERHLIEKSVTRKPKLKTPWRHLLTSPTVWTMGLNHFTVSWVFSSMTASLPSYMANVLHFDIEQNGVVSALPFLVQYLVAVGASILADMIRTRGWLSTQNTRRLLNTSGAVLSATFFIVVSYVEQPAMLAVALLTASIGFNSLCVCCVRVCHLDIAPAFAGTLYGLTNTLSALPGFIGPAIVGALTKNQNTIEQWRIFFFITAFLYLFDALIFCIFIKGEELWWAKATSFSFTYDRIEEDDSDSSKKQTMPDSQPANIGERV